MIAPIMKNLVPIAGLCALLTLEARAYNYSGIYYSSLSADDSTTSYDGNVLFLVRTNNQAMLVGSGSGPNNIGLAAKFTVAANGTFSVQTNGLSFSGSIDTNGSLSGDLNVPGGGHSTLDGSWQQDTGDYQNAAGFYSGSWSGGGTSGRMQLVMTAYGEFDYTIFNSSDRVTDGGGSPDQVDIDNTFFSTSIKSAELHGTFLPASLKITGSITGLSGSINATFTLTRIASVPRQGPASISVPPQDKSVFYGANASFSVTATGTAPLYYQWFADDVAITKATGRTLVISNAQPSLSGTVYKVVVANDYGQDEAEAILTVRPPAPTITTPVSGQRVTNAHFTVKGHSTTKWPVSSIWYKLNDDDTSYQATGITNWSADVTLRAGTNTFYVYAIDNYLTDSPTNRVSFDFVVKQPIVLITNGPGGITRNFTGNVIEVGRAYTVTGVPKSGQVFSNWTGTINSGSASLTFLMQTNMVLQANFVSNPFITRKGSYVGLFGDSANRSHAQSGYFTLSLADKGSFTASLKRGTNSYPFSGQFDAGGHATKTYTVAGLPWTVSLTLDLSGSDTISGTVSNAQWTVDLLANHPPFNATNNPATDFAGKYTLILPGNNNPSSSPGGDGYAAVSVSKGGTVTASGSFGEGSALSQTVAVASDGSWAFYVPLYGGQGSAWGWLTFDANHPAETIGGDVSWIKPVRPGAYYPAGFTNIVNAAGARYVAPTNSRTRVIDVTNGIVIFDGGNLSGPFTNLVTVTSSNRVFNGSANALSLSITTSNGTFSGKVVVPGTTRTNSFKGAVVQQLDTGYGYFLGTNQSGSVWFGRP